MADPFNALRTPLAPMAPDPAFAARLRARLVQALNPVPPRGDSMTTTTPAPDSSTALNPRPGDLAYVSLWVPDVERAAAFFSAVLGWRYGTTSYPRERQVEGLTLHHGIWGGEDHTTLFLCVTVDDLSAAVERVRAAGGTAEEPHEEPYGWISGCTDDQGMQFALFQAPDGPAGRGPDNGVVHGDLSYITVEVVDSARFRAFFGAVLGWRFQPGRVEDGWGVDDVVPMVGFQGGHDRAVGVPMYRVDDIASAVARVRAAGGTATDPERQPYATTSECTDDQGTRFYLGQH
jgi:predicted enzyme related to lactoylglutathione lyase